MNMQFDHSWKQWIDSNIASGCDKNGIFKILLDEGFDYQAIKQEMQYEPDIPPFMIPNPLKGNGGSSSTKSESKQGPAITEGEIYLPNSEKIDSESIELFTVDGFLTDQECVSLIEIIRSHSEYSKQTEQSDTLKALDCRLSTDIPLIADLDARICSYVGVNTAYSESITGYSILQRQGLSALNFQSQKDSSNQYSVSVVIFLNKADHGGEIFFEKPGLRILPKTGNAVIWRHFDKNDQCSSTLFSGIETVKNGNLYCLVKSFTLKSSLSHSPRMYCKEASEYIPNYTRDGFVKSQYPKDAFADILKFYRANTLKIQQEHVPGDFVFNKDKKKQGSSLVDLTEELRSQIHAITKPMVEAWCGIELEPSFVYGIRIYHDQAVLKSHRDRVETHIVGVIINVDQKVNRDWPLIIEDHFYRKHHVLLKPGEMVFYESGRLMHGRPIPLDGQLFANIFCHFKPVGYAQRNFR